MFLDETKLQNGFGAWETYNIMCEVYDDGVLVDFVLNKNGNRSPQRPFDRTTLRTIGKQYKKEYEALSGSIYN